MEKLHIIELSSIIDLNPKINIINKEDPNNVILNIPYNELELLKSGWQKYNNRIYYNGNVYWLHPKYLKELDEQNINNIGIRITLDYQTKFEIETNFLKQIPKNEKIVILFEESNELKIKNSVIDKIEKTLKHKNYNIFNFSTIQPNSEKYLATADVLLSYLTGYKVNNEQFSATEVSQADVLYYYDSDIDRLKYLTDIDIVLKDRYQNSVDNIKKNIYQQLKFIKNTFILNLMHLYRNDANPINKKTIKLGLERIFEHIVSYKKFKSI